MCGIIGVWRFDGRPVGDGDLRSLTDPIRYRGPDDEGLFHNESVGLGMRRLSIIDLAGGSQPISSADGRYVIVFNGELYNYRELRDDLRAAGHVFRTESDTETVLVGYQAWGADVLQRMIGMWGFAIWDNREHELFLARDRLGKKQIFYALTDDFLVFGSEMRTPLEYPGVDRSLDMASIREFLTYSYVGSPNTAVRGVRLLPEGCWARVDAEGEMRIEPYWTMVPTAEPIAMGEQETAEEIYRLLVDAVEKRLVSDVPVALMLSSGLDSSSIAYVLTRELGAQLQACSVGFSDPQFDESQDAGALAARFDLPWERRMVSARDAAEAFPDIVEHTSSLQANAAQFVYYFTNQLVHELGFKVALNGAGGDELFVGYPTFRANRIFRQLRRLPTGVRGAMAFGARHLPVSFGRVSLDYKARKFTEVLTRDGGDPLLAHASWREIFDRDALEATLLDGAGPADGSHATYRRAYAQIDHASPLKTCLYADLRAWLIPMMPWIDNMSMASSVELRLPYLDHRLVTRALASPDDVLFRGWKLKRVMKQYLKGRLPDDVLYRKKRGTHIPLSKWLNGEFAPIADHYLDDGVLNRHGLFRMEHVRRLRQEHKDQRRDRTFPLWNLVVLSAWMERFGVTA